ncbi:MAG: hydroxymethylbilane synthase [Bacteroidetes bacterium]|nr:hydroxymethylbilane synthase [Bacteroidota bacterium]
MEKTIRIGTRGSKLALYQAYKVKEELENKYPDYIFEIIIIKTKGDIILDVPLSKIGDKGLFTKELEVAMFNNEIDMAVHSLKDLPTTFPEGAKLGAVLKRGDVRDALISTNNRKISDLTSNDVIATSSLRRKAQLLKINKDFKIVEIRGNVNTRIRKMQEGYCDVMIMAAAGLQRLEMSEFISELIDPSVMIPACSQGAIAIEIRENDAFIENLLSKINDEETFITTSAERAFLKTLEGGCQIPVGSFSKIEGNQFHITGFISNIDGSQFLKETASANVDNAVKISVEIAKKLFSNGGKEILDAIRDLNLAAPKVELPLKDKIIISTRAIESGDSLPDLLKSQGANVISLPMIEVSPAQLENSEKELLNKLSDFDWIFFTSKNGVLNFFKHLSDLKGSTALPENIKIAVIGSRTASELDYYGYAPSFISKGNTSEDFLTEFYNVVNPINQKVLLSLGNLADDTLINKLSKENKVERINVYQTEKPKSVDTSILEIIKQNKYDLIVFTSPSTFYNFCSFYEKDKIQHLKMASIGSTTTKAIEEAGYSPIITAKMSKAEGLSESISEYFKK